MRKFLIFYLLFILFLIVSFFILRREGKTAQGQVQNNRKKIVIIETEEIEPFGRVICKTVNGSIFTDWMNVEDAVIAKAEMKERYRNSNLEIFIQYDKYPY